MKTLVKSLAGALGAVMLFAASTQAATVSVSYDEPLVDVGVPTADSTSGLVEQGVSGSIGGQRRSPWETTANPGYTYTSVYGNSSATFLLGSLMNSLTFMWGSVDTYNTMEFYNNGNKVDTVVGQDAINEGATPGLEFIIATILTDAYFDEVRFISDSNSFEFANVEISAVPLPAALPLYGAGVAILGFLGWRKRRAAA
ncbi:hypothetical protein [Sneathiella limimaris]|uniref:Npun_F0296 family exosortase-dependent surface protein n=1 Tax=Sneathiella limimaris TaxID=1964213 RepID=UPI00146EAEA0|nr:hypothetical protein [Sneathiella limimaris]